MKQTLLSSLVIGAVASMAATGAFAGQIQSSSVSIAREVITTNTQAIVAPSVSYRFAGDVDARVQTQTFQVQLTLGNSAAWSGVAVSADSIGLTNNVTGTALVNGVDFTVDAIGYDSPTNPKTLFATITVPTATGLVQQPIVTFNAASATAPATVVNLKDLVGDLVADFTASGKCVDVKTLGIDVKHFTALTSPTSLATTANASADEHLRGGATNTATLMTFPTNILPVMATSAGDAKVDVSAANLKFAGTTGSFVSATMANLGTVTLTQNATGYDANLLNQYLLTGNPALSGLTGAATASLTDGNVEASNVTVKVAATNGFVVGSTVFLATDALCAVPVVNSAKVIAAATAAGPVDLVVDTAAINADAFGANGATSVHVCYNVAGVTQPIPLSSFSAITTVTKAAAGAGFNEQNNMCAGSLYSLGGGVKIDVRNYASSADAEGWMSVIRLINNNESRTIDVWGQLIHPDGTYGPWGKLTDLAPRAVLNMTAKEIDAKLLSAPAAGAANGASTPTAYGAAGAPRLRITSNSGSTLRVQNYMFNPATGAVMEFSGAQGVDFEGTSDRAPVNEGQYQSQDAQAGLNGK